MLGGETESLPRKGNTMGDFFGSFVEEWHNATLLTIMVMIITAEAMLYVNGYIAVKLMAKERISLLTMKLSGDAAPIFTNATECGLMLYFLYISAAKAYAGIEPWGHTLLCGYLIYRPIRGMGWVVICKAWAFWWQLRNKKILPYH